jgi:hypothetical protein
MALMMRKKDQVGLIELILRLVGGTLVLSKFVHQRLANSTLPVSLTHRISIASAVILADRGPTEPAV